MTVLPGRAGDKLSSTLTAHVRLSSWRRHAACIGQLEVFYSAQDWDQRVAKAICAGCGVREDCLAEALAEETFLGTGSVFGVRGGLDAGQRRALVPVATEHVATA